MNGNDSLGRGGQRGVAEASHHSPFPASHRSRWHPSSLTYLNFSEKEHYRTQINDNGKIRLYKGYDCQALILQKHFSISPGETSALPGWSFPGVWHFASVSPHPFSYHSSHVDKSTEKNGSILFILK